MLFRGWASQTIGRLEMIIAAAQQGEFQKTNEEFHRKECKA